MAGTAKPTPAILTPTAVALSTATLTPAWAMVSPVMPVWIPASGRCLVTISGNWTLGSNQVAGLNLLVNGNSTNFTLWGGNVGTSGLFTSFSETVIITATVFGYTGVTPQAVNNFQVQGETNSLTAALIAGALIVQPL